MADSAQSGSEVPAGTVPVCQHHGHTMLDKGDHWACPAGDIIIGREQGAREVHAIEPRVRFFAAKLDDGPVKPGGEHTWPTFGIRYSFYVETHDLDAADQARERLWESPLSDIIDAFVEGRGGPDCAHVDSITCGNDGFMTCLDCAAETTDVGRVRVFIAALVEIATRATVERNPDGVDQAAHTMQLIAREALGMSTDG